MRGWGCCPHGQPGGRARAPGRSRAPLRAPRALLSSPLLLSQLLVLDPVRAPRQRRLQGAGLGLRGFGKEFENGREALPGSELVAVGACKTRIRLPAAWCRAEAAGPRARPRSRGPSRPHLYLRLRSGPGAPGELRSAGAAPPEAAAAPAAAPSCPGRGDAAPASPVARGAAGRPGARPLRANGGSRRGATPSAAWKPPLPPARRARGLVSPRGPGFRAHQRPRRSALPE